jgi:putative pyruvate formate lyase activating enzyme
MIPQVKAIIRGLRDRGLYPITVYNTGGYDKPEVIDTLNGLIDVYLPDYKYATACIAEKYSDASDYPEIALAALKRMYYQKGSVLHTDNEGRASSGILVRHLVLPGNTGESKKVLRSIADELSPGMNISLMSQYNPVAGSGLSPLPDRPLYKSEYEMVVEVMNELGFRNGWLQEMDSYLNYRPDFRRGNPFEDKR